ncbi:MAG: di-heme enzyme [Sandaracinus sp.]|nr:di-heme enzyme [Sandaracinus sp.]
MIRRLPFALVLAWVACGPSDGAYEWELPYGFPEPRVPADNAMSAERAELGRHLFYDTAMSGNGSMSCASCHEQRLAFTDGLPKSVGSTGETHPRSAMTLANVAYAPTLTWANPNLRDLEHQAQVPMFGELPVELGLAGREGEVLMRLRDNPVYEPLFRDAFPGDADPYTILNVTKALGAFQRTLISGDSAYDRYLAGDDAAISESAKRGADLFFGEEAECFHCHGSFLFSASVDHANNVFDQANFQNNGLYNIDGRGAYPPENTGLYEHTGDFGDMGKFKPPSLRNIAVTAPYMHDGSIETLDEVLDHYARGGRLLTEGPFVGDGALNPNKSLFVNGFELTDERRADLLAFLESLTDEAFLTNPDFANPWLAP